MQKRWLLFVIASQPQRIAHARSGGVGLTVIMLSLVEVWEAAVLSLSGHGELC